MASGEEKGSARRRFAGDLVQVAGVVAPYMRIPNFLQYSEDLAKAPLNRNRILEFAEMWKELSSVGKLIFSQNQAEDIFTSARELAEPTWTRKMSSGEFKTWLPSISRQFRCMCSHLTAAREKKALWAGHLFEGSTSSSPLAVPAAAEAELQQAPIASAKSSSSGSAEYIYGYDKEHEVAWRLASTLGATKEFAPVTSSADKDDSQHPVAVFDGKPVEIKP